MSHVPHELIEEFPDAVAKIGRLRVADAHFKRLAEEYHDVNREIHRIETNITPSSDVYALELRRKRLSLKDRIAASLAQMQV